MKFTWVLGLGLVLSSISANLLAVDVNEIEKALTTTGLDGSVHGVVNDQHIYVFTYRNPDDFFDYLIMSLVPSKPALAKTLAGLSRQDKVRIKGTFLVNPSPQKHISVESLEVVEKYTPVPSAPPYEHQAKIPKDLLNLTKATFMVHTVAGDGHILVAEYKDAVIPVYVKNGELTKNLYRNDLVQLEFKIQASPNEPTHLNLDETSPTAVTMIDSISAKNGSQATLEGELILFPKSPEIAFNVFALKESLPGGANRQYTLANMEDAEVFKKIRAALQTAWDKYPGEYVNGRNKLLSKRLRVKATGTINEIDPNQANPQILLKSVESVQIIELPAASSPAKSDG